MVCNQSEGRNIQVLRLDDIPFASQTDYILALARLHTNPSDWIKNKTDFGLSYFLAFVSEKELGKKPDFLILVYHISF